MAGPPFLALSILKGSLGMALWLSMDFSCQRALGAGEGEKETNNCRMPLLSLQMFFINLYGGYEYSHFTDKLTGTQATTAVSSRDGMQSRVHSGPCSFYHTGPHLQPQLGPRTESGFLFQSLCWSWGRRGFH